MPHGFSIAGFPVLTEVRHDKTRKQIDNTHQQQGHDATTVVMAHLVERFGGAEA